jgi:hypothetical protein
MSSLAETARQEGDEAEAAEEVETPTAPTPDEPEPDEPPAPAAPAGLTEQEREREYKKLEKLAMTYLPKAVTMAQHLGMPIEVCPLCEFPGLAIPRDADEVTSDVEATVLRLIGKSAPQEFKESAQYHRCETCDGWGEVLTGAQKEISRTAICNPCGGKGFVIGPIQVPPPVAGNGVYTPPPPPLAPFGVEPPKPEPYYDYGTREWKLPPQATGV